MEKAAKIIVSFGEEVARPEKKKLILPVLITFMFISATIYGLHLRDNKEIDAQLAESTADMMFKLSEINTENEYYPNKSGLVNETVLEERSQNISSEAQEELAKISSKPQIQLFGYSYYFYPVVPGSFFTQSSIVELDDGLAASNTGYGNLDSSKHKSIFFTPSKGYLLTEEGIHSANTIILGQKQIESLKNKINTTNISYGEFKDNYTAIKSTEFPEDYPQYADETQVSKLKEVQFIHFLPAYIVTFGFYYLLSGLLITSFRYHKKLAERVMIKYDPDIAITSSATIFYLSATVGIWAVAGFLTQTLGNIPTNILIAQAVLGASFIGLSKTLKNRHRWLERSTLLIGISILSILLLPDIQTAPAIGMIVGLSLTLELTSYEMAKCVKKDFT